jgi:hypothetical protein
MFAKANGSVVRASFLGASFLLIAVSTSASSPTVQISGTPLGEALAGQTYTFKASGIAQGGVPRFEIENKPGWATFDPTWGRLQGVPRDADAGIWDGIRISLTNGIDRVSLPEFSIRVRTAGASHFIAILWNPPSLNSDGSALTDLAGYRLYSGRTAAVLKRVATIGAGLTRYALDSLEAGRYFFAMTAVNAAGVESELSETVSAGLE